MAIINNRKLEVASSSCDSLYTNQTWQPTKLTSTSAILQWLVHIGGVWSPRDTAGTLAPRCRQLTPRMTHRTTADAKEAVHAAHDEQKVSIPHTRNPEQSALPYQSPPTTIHRKLTPSHTH
eukprot:m.328868 g.328868  ORF g.328868 m.328868 type:complete len:121 (-) comp16502_c1_seq45:95-457(-)